MDSFREGDRRHRLGRDRNGDGADAVAVAVALAVAVACSLAQHFSKQFMKGLVAEWNIFPIRVQIKTRN